ncbi:hypothetical protein ABVK25_005784 [Lepraria finkii]|uniref:Uncharacterized protein n=1 Tax=Lepraria finkii TaxID=1340010 RepID=A0ABR4B7M5_9LECA
MVGHPTRKSPQKTIDRLHASDTTRSKSAMGACLLPHLQGMELQKPTKVAIQVGREGAFSFLDLPGEIRNEIYRYALLAKRNKSCKTMWDCSQYSGQSYIFATGLLYTNHQIHREASAIFYAENNFVMLRLQQRPLVGVILNKQILATAVTFKAVDYPHMAIEVDLGNDKNMAREHRSNQLVFALQDLETFGLVICELWMKDNILIGATWINAINPSDLPDKINSEPVLEAPEPDYHLWVVWNRRQWAGRAIPRASQVVQTHEVVKHAIEYAKKYITLTHFPSHKAYLYITIAELDKLHGSVVKLENAVFWYSEALQYERDDATAKEGLERAKKTLYFRDSRNW